jgi:hypothetical protein
MCGRTQGRRARHVWTLGLLLAMGSTAQARPIVHVTEPREPGLPDPAVPSATRAGFCLASDGSQWLSAYAEVLGGEYVALGRLTGADGQPLSAPFVIAYGFTPKAMVFDGDDYVVFGERASGAAFVRVTRAGTSTGEVTLLSAPLGPSFTVAAASSGTGHEMMAVVCEQFDRCKAFRISGAKVRTLPRLPVTAVTQIVYSNSRWLVLGSAPDIAFDMTMLQLDALGNQVDGTLKSLGTSDHPSVAAATATGFALARDAWPLSELLMVDTAGVTTTKGKYGAEGDNVSPRNLVRQGSGYLLFASYAHGNGGTPVEQSLVQLFDGELSPVGDPLILPASGPVALAEGGAQKVLMTTNGDTLRSRLLDLSLPVSSGDATVVSIAPVGQQRAFVSPAPDGWLLLWQTDYWQSPWQYARLGDDGALVGKPKRLPDGMFVQSVSRGPGGWLLASDSCAGQDFDEDDTPCTVMLSILPDAGKLRSVEPLGPMSFPDQLSTRMTFSVTGSEHGWLVLWSAANELHASRLDEQGGLVDDIVLADKPPGRPAVASAFDGDGYRAFWWDAATEKLWSAALPATGAATASPAVQVGARQDVWELASASSGDDFWLLGDSVCREPACQLGAASALPKRAWFQANDGAQHALPSDSLGALVSVGDAALGVLSDGRASPFPPVQLGLADVAGPLEVIHTFEGGMNPTLATKADGRALLAFTHVSTDSGPPVSRVVTSVITVEPQNVGGEGGQGGASMGGAVSKPSGGVGQGGDNVGGTTAGDDGVGGTAAGNEDAGSPTAPNTNSATSKGCGCSTKPQRGAGLGLLVPFAWLLRRRRKAAAAGARTRA